MDFNIGQTLQQIEARLARVERSARLSNASLDGTSLAVKDSAGVVRGHIGMQPDGTIGLVAQDGPAPGAPTAPAVTPSLGGLRIVWDGTLQDGGPLPADFDHIAVHVSTSSGFTPSAATFVGTITRSGDGGMLPVTPLPYAAHYVRLIAVNTSAAASTPSAQTAATPLQVDGPDLAAGSVTAASIEAGAVTADKLEAILQLATRLVAGNPAGARVELNEDGLRVYDVSNALVIRFDAADGSGVFTGAITGSTVTGGLIRTALTGARVTVNEAGANKVLVYDAVSPTAIGELSERGLLLEGTNGSLMWLDPDALYPTLRMTNAAGTNEAVLNVVENTPGSANPGLNTGQFTGSGFTDMKWRLFMGDDFASLERIRNSNNATAVGGRVDLRNNYASIGMADSTGTTQTADVVVTPGVAKTRGRHIIQPYVGDTNSVLFVQPGPSHTGYVIRCWDPDNSMYRFAVDRLGNTDVNGILTAGNMAAGRISIVPSAANTPTSANVTGLNLKGSNFRVVATPSSSVPGTQVTGVGVTAVTSSGFTVWLTRTNTTSTGIDWIVFGV